MCGMQICVVRVIQEYTDRLSCLYDVSLSECERLVINCTYQCHPHYPPYRYGWGYIVSWTRLLPPPALDVLHHQRGEERVWPLLQGFRGTERNVDMTNEIRVVTCIANYHAPQIP